MSSDTDDREWQSRVDISIDFYEHDYKGKTPTVAVVNDDTYAALNERGLIGNDLLMNSYGREIVVFKFSEVPERNKPSILESMKGVQLPLILCLGGFEQRELINLDQSAASLSQC